MSTNLRDAMWLGQLHGPFDLEPPILTRGRDIDAVRSDLAKRTGEIGVEYRVGEKAPPRSATYATVTGVKDAKRVTWFDDEDDALAAWGEHLAAPIKEAAPWGKAYPRVAQARIYRIRNGEWQEWTPPPHLIARAEELANEPENWPNYDKIVQAIQDAVEEEAGQKAAEAWSTVSDVLLEKYNAGDDGKQIVVEARFGDGYSINGDDRSSSESLRDRLRDFRDYVQTRDGGRAPSNEQEIQFDVIEDRVARKLNIDTDKVHAVAKREGLVREPHLDLTYASASGETTVYVRRDVYDAWREAGGR